mgnify:CR=1 FL=1
MCAISEHYNIFAKIRQDLFGFVDLVCLGEREIVAIQTTSGSNFSARVNKVCAHPNTRRWLAAGGIILIHAWAKKGARGKVKHWALTERQITAEML